MKLFFSAVMLSNCKPVTHCWFSFFHYYRFQFNKKEFAVNEDDGGNRLQAFVLSPLNIFLFVFLSGLQRVNHVQTFGIDLGTVISQIVESSVHRKHNKHSADLSAPSEVLLSTSATTMQGDRTDLVIFYLSTPLQKLCGFTLASQSLHFRAQRKRLHGSCKKLRVANLSTDHSYKLIFRSVIPLSNHTLLLSLLQMRDITVNYVK